VQNKAKTQMMEIIYTRILVFTQGRLIRIKQITEPISLT